MRDISMIHGEPGSPEWKVLWDKARNYVRQDNYLQAVETYAELYRLKSNIEEANWEYCKALLKVKDYSTAQRIIGGLLDHDPDNSEYLMAGGTVALHWKNYVTAADYFGRVLEKDPSGTYSDPALLGLATSLRNQGKLDLAFSLFEQYSLRHPENRSVLHTLAVDAHKLGKDEKARNLYDKLLEDSHAPDEIILEAIQVFDALGSTKKTSELWREYLSRHPDYTPFRQKLVQYYREGGAFDTALQQLEYLVEHNADNDEYLLAAAQICEDDLHRPEKALVFYEKYMQKHPADAHILEKVSRVETVLAVQFVDNVEKDGADKLWQDLAAVAPYRAAIFSKMVELLGKKGENDQLIEVLTTLHTHSPARDSLTLRLAQLHYQRAHYKRALDYLTELTGKAGKTKSYFLMKGDCEDRLGMEIKALESFERALLLDPDDIALRQDCVKLAGGIGNGKAVESLFAAGLKRTGGLLPADFVFTYLEMLSYNYLFDQYARASVWAEVHFATTAEIRAELLLHRAKALRKEGKARQAEQLLRQMLLGTGPLDDVLFQLAENAVSDQKTAVARIWLQQLQKSSGGPDSSLSYDPKGARLLLLQIKILQAEEEYAKGQERIEAYISEAKKHKNKVLAPWLRLLQKQYCWLCYHKGEFQKAFRQSESLLDDGAFDPELVALQDMIQRSQSKTAAEIHIDSRLDIDAHPVVSRQLVVALRELEYGDYGGARKHAGEALQTYPDSAIGNGVWTELMLHAGTSNSAIAALKRLIQQFPDETYFHQKRIEIEARRGMYAQALMLLEKEHGKDGDLKGLAAELMAKDHPEQPLTLARLLWGDKQQKQALQIYERLLQPSVQELLGERFRQKQINYHDLTRDNTFWNSMTIMLKSEPDVVAELMSPQFLLDNRHNETGAIVSELYEKYSWQKLIAGEYIARKAIFERNYYYAEQSYKRLARENSTEGMSDLAAIYEKIGKYRKEAQVYEAMQKNGTTSPELEKSIARTTQQIRPQSVFTAEYEEQSGRNGHIDVARTTLGTSFWFTPELDKDIRVEYANNQFASLETDDTTSTNYLYTVATYEFSRAYEFILGGGAEKVADNNSADFLYHLELKGQLDDYINGYMMLEKRPVYDTVEAIQDQITYQSFETGLNVETPVGLSFGGDLRHRYYNDSNGENRLHGFSSYSIFGDSVQLALRYDYQYLTNDDANSDTGNGSQQTNDLPYWSPSFYTEHRLNLHFQHDFLGYQQGTKKSMSYYAIDNAIGFEDNENLIYTTKINIFLEMSPHFLLKGNFTLTRSDDYEDKGLFMSLHYRW